MSAEDAIDNCIEVLEKELRPLMKRKRNLQMDIQYDIAKLIKTAPWVLTKMAMGRDQFSCSVTQTQ
jgi:hypothetical protein